MPFKLRKRIFDLALSIPAFFFLSLLMLIMAVLVRLKIGLPVVFRQVRQELFNVIKGDMSVVGPRPLLMQYLDRYTPEQARRHEVRPGITPVKYATLSLT